MAKKLPELPEIPELPRLQIPECPLDPPDEAQTQARIVREVMAEAPVEMFRDAGLRTSLAQHVGLLYPRGIPIEESVVGEIVSASIGVDVHDDWTGRSGARG